jgi:hypothetical protein
MKGTKEDTRNMIFSMAKDSLAGHTIKHEASASDFNVWLCRNPESSFYWYRVITVPGCLIIQGDVGNRMFVMYDKNPVSWLRGAINSPDYVMGKCEDKSKDFLPGEARKLLEQLKAGESPTDEDGNTDDSVVAENEEVRSKVEEIEEAWEYEMDSHKFCQAYYEAGFDTESLECCYDFNSDILWSYACMKKFIELLDTQATKV